MNTYPYLLDKNFLKEFDELQLKEQFIRIIVLDWYEKPIQNIEGQVTSGSISLDGQSSVRRTCNLTFTADEHQAQITKVENLLSINKKIKLEIGFTNITKTYPQYKKIWFPLGTYLIINPSITHNNNGINISLQLKDKMCLLNGECGGVIPAAVDFTIMESYDDNGQLITTQPTIYQIIQEVVNHYGGEQLGKIIISGLDKKVKQMVQWHGNKPLYYVQKDTAVGKVQFYTTDENEIFQLSSSDDFQEYTLGDDIGYQLVDFIYPDELNVDAGATVCSVLDSIKEKLGNFEYFYDLDGNFIFQEIPNFLNTSQSTNIISEIKGEKNILKNLGKNAQLYLTDRTSGKTVYRFSNQKIITSYANTPQYSMIKNDFVVWGTRKTVDGLEFPIRYHLAIDEKPIIADEIYQLCFYEDEELGYEIPFLPVNTIKISSEVSIGTENNYLKAQIPDRNPEYIYLIIDTRTPGTSFKYLARWDTDEKRFKAIRGSVCDVKATDWRTQLLINGLQAKKTGADTNYYYAELLNEWPKIYDIKGIRHDINEVVEGTFYNNQKEKIDHYYEGIFREEAVTSLTSMDYFLDFIEPTGLLQGLSVNQIGRRTKVLNDKSVNCIFEPIVPDYILIEKGVLNSQEEYGNTNEKRRYCIDKGYAFLQVDDNIIRGIGKGGHYNSAFYTIQDLLYQYTGYNESITLNCLPIYYLEPNTRIFVSDSKSDIQGEYAIQSLTMPLDINGTMTITANKVLDKI